MRKILCATLCGLLFAGGLASWAENSPANPGGAAVSGVASSAEIDREFDGLGKMLKQSFVVESGLFKPTREAIVQRYVTEKKIPARQAVLELARGEAESFQVIFLPDGIRNGPRGLAFKSARLKGPRGYQLHANAVHVCRVGYVLPESGKRLPDPLLDDLNQGEFTDPCVIWTSISVPSNAPAGRYSGALELVGDGKPISVPVQLTVWDFAVPKQGHLKTDFWFFRGQIKHHYGNSDDPGFNEVSKYLDLALEHRITPIDCCEGNASPLYRIYREPDGKLSIDWSEFDRYAEYVISHGGTALHLGPTHWFNGRFSDKLKTDGSYDPDVAIVRATGEKELLAYPYLSKEHLAMLQWYLREAVAHFRTKGWLKYAFLQPLDEVPENDENRLILQTCRDADPAVKLLMDVVRPKEAKLFRDLIDVWCPLSPSLPDGGFETVRAEGDQVWWYVCCYPLPPHANLFVNQSCVEHRQLFWQSWKYGVDGLLYWGINFWHWWGSEPKFSVTNAWPNSSWTYGSQGQGNFGDGYFIYPGMKGPQGSIRLEAIRDGQEDYEYLWLLSQRVKAAEAKKVPAEKLARAKQLLAVPDSFCKDLTTYSRSENDLAQIRRQVAAEILKLR